MSGTWSVASYASSHMAHRNASIKPVVGFKQSL
jgi:hypothetical protein